MNCNKENVSRYEVYQATNYWYKWDISKKLTSKIEDITFWMTWSTDFDSNLLKIDKSSCKKLVFTTLNVVVQCRSGVILIY